MELFTTESTYYPGGGVQKSAPSLRCGTKQLTTLYHSDPRSFLHLHHTFVCLSDIGSCSISHSLIFSPYKFTYKCSLQGVIVLIQGLWLQLQHQYWIFTYTPLWYHIVDQSHGDPVSMVPQDRPLYDTQQLIDVVDVRVGLLKALNLGLGSSWFGQPECSPGLFPRRRPGLPNPMKGEARTPHATC